MGASPLFTLRRPMLSQRSSTKLVMQISTPLDENPKLPWGHRAALSRANTRRRRGEILQGGSGPEEDTRYYQEAGAVIMVVRGAEHGLTLFCLEIRAPGGGDGASRPVQALRAELHAAG